TGSPRSGGRMQPRAQALGGSKKDVSPEGGERSVTTYPEQCGKRYTEPAPADSTNFVTILIFLKRRIRPPQPRKLRRLGFLDHLCPRFSHFLAHEVLSSPSIPRLDFAHGFCRARRLVRQIRRTSCALLAQPFSTLGGTCHALARRFSVRVFARGF